MHRIQNKVRWRKWLYQCAGWTLLPCWGWLHCLQEKQALADDKGVFAADAYENPPSVFDSLSGKKDDPDRVNPLGNNQVAIVCGTIILGAVLIFSSVGTGGDFVSQVRNCWPLIQFLFSRCLLQCNHRFSLLSKLPNRVPTPKLTLRVWVQIATYRLPFFYESIATGFREFYAVFGSVWICWIMVALPLVPKGT